MRDNLKAKEGIVFFVVSVLMFILIGCLTLEYGIKDPKIDKGYLWMPIVLFITSIINSIRSFKQNQKYYMWGSFFISLGLILFIFIPFLLN